MVQDWTKFGRCLRDFRKRSGLSQKQLTHTLNYQHHLAGISNGLISKWERAYEHQGRRWSPDRQTVLQMIIIFAPYITPDEARCWGDTAGYALTTEEIQASFPHLFIETTAAFKAQKQNGHVTDSLPSDVAHIGNTLARQDATNLPSQITPFVGRQAEIRDLLQLLRHSEIRLLTLTGPGGMGKTRLAIEVAKQIDEFSNGVYFVNLAPLTDVKMIVSAIAKAVGFTFHNEQETPKQQLLNYLQSKHLLLILDNFEHLLQGAKLLIEILQVADAIKIVVTSRERLKLRNETVFGIGGLQYEGGDTASGLDAIDLFLAQAARTVPNYKPTDDALLEIKYICKLVGGMPLGILLAVSWLDLLTPKEIVQQIQQGLHFLSGNWQDLPSRHRSMKVVFEGSWQKLDVSEQHVFQQLSVFRGGFTLQAAQVVTQASLTSLMTLVQKSFLIRTPNERFEIHELLRQYGAEILRVSPENGARTQERHSDYYLTLLQNEEMNLHGPDQENALDRISLENQNIHQAWAWAAKQGNFTKIDLALDSLYTTYDLKHAMQEGIDLFEKAIQYVCQARKSTELNIVLGRLIARQGAFYIHVRSNKQAEALLHQSLKAFRSVTLPKEIAFCLTHLGYCADFAGDYTRAESLLQESLEISITINDQLGLIRNYTNLGVIAWEKGDIERAIQYHQNALSVCKELQNLRLTIVTLNHLATTTFFSSHPEKAEQYYAEIVMQGRILNGSMGMDSIFSSSGWVEAYHGGKERLEKAKLLIQRNLETFRDFGRKWNIAGHLLMLGEVYYLNGEYDKAKAYFEESKTMSETFDIYLILISGFCRLGLVNSQLGCFEAARYYLYTALTHTIEKEMYVDTLDAMYAWVIYLLRSNELSNTINQTFLQNQKEALLLLLLIGIYSAGFG